MAQQSLYYRTELETKISVFPNQLNGDIDDHILANLKEKVEGKTMENGLIIRVNELIDYWNGVIDGINNMGTTVFNVKYECYICSPTKNLEVTCRVQSIIKGYIVSMNGPLSSAVQISMIDDKFFNVNGDTVTHIESDRVISHGDYIKVSIAGINSMFKKQNIMVYGKLLGFATDDEIEIYKEEQRLVKGLNRNDSNESRFI